MNRKDRKLAVYQKRSYPGTLRATKQIELPHAYKGFTAKRNDESKLCPFYSYCVVDKELNGQLHCIMSRKVICDKQIKIRECDKSLTAS